MREKENVVEKYKKIINKKGTRIWYKKGENNMKFPKKAELTKNDYIDLIDKLINLKNYQVGLVVRKYLQSKRNELRSENEILLQKSIDKINKITSLSGRAATIRTNILKNEYNKIENKIKDNYKKIEALNLEY